MKTFPAHRCVYTMSRRHSPIGRVRIGERFVVRTQDCYSGSLRTTRDRFTRDMWPRVNPATGPIDVEGTAPGEVLAVTIERINVPNRATMYVEPGQGALSDHLTGPQTRLLKITGKHLRFDRQLQLPIDPMVGVIGTAPVGKSILTGTPGEHGGNMDCRFIRVGSTVFLPVAVPGARLALGDVHVLMADGEVAVCGAEAPAAITCSCRVLSADRIVTPAVLADEKLMILASAKTLEGCERKVLDKSMSFLTRVLGLAANRAAMLLSLIGDLRVCQVVDPLKTMRVELPVAVLRSLGWSADAIPARR